MSLTECGVSAYDHETSIMKRPWLTGVKKKETQRRIEGAKISVDVSTRFKVDSLRHFQSISLITCSMSLPTVL
jgi:hypothetical protein